MLRVYGPLMPLRKLEETIRWKTREKEHARFIREIIPDLEAPYATLMEDWEKVFDATLTKLRGFAESGRGAEPEWAEACLRQSAEFSRHLAWMGERSVAVRRAPYAPALFRQLIGELEQFREENDTPEDFGGPEPADGALRPEGTWSDPTGKDGAVFSIAGMGAGASVPIGGHTLPPLPYAYNALEPWIDEKTMRIHHDKHHQSYVDGLNKAEKKLQEARTTGDFDLVKHWERELAFNGAGHYLHTIFWEAMTPKPGTVPSPALEQEIVRSFGSFDAFRKQFSEAANKVEGGGWAILVWSPRSRRLEILTAEKHQNLSQWDVVPLLPLDVWEHAYYLKHQNDRAAYVKDWWNVVNWPYVSERFAKARTLQWKPY